MDRLQRLDSVEEDVAQAASHPGYVAIPQAGAEGLRSYREPDRPHPLQRRFLERQGEREWKDAIRALLAAGRFDEAARRIEADLEPFGGRIARIAKSFTLDAIAIEGWEDLEEIIAEFQGPRITAITAGLGNEPDLVFAEGQDHEPLLMFNLYSDDVFRFTGLPREQLLAECEADCPGWAGEEEDVEFYVGIEGFAPLNGALIRCKHVHFLRDGRDDVRDRAPGGYCEYVLGCWLRTVRFLQAVAREVERHGLPPGVRLITGTVGLNADVATLIEPADRGASEPAAAGPAAPAAAAPLTMKKWEPRHDPLADMETGSSLRQRLGGERPAAQQAGVRELPVVAPEADPVPTEAPSETPPQEPQETEASDEPQVGWLRRLWMRLRGAA